MAYQRPWQSDAEIERSGGGAVMLRTRGAAPGGPKPWATYGLLISFLAVFLAELLVRYAVSLQMFYDVFTIQSVTSRTQWLQYPWSPLTATFSHSVDHPLHILVNGLTLYFFGPELERLMRRARFLAFFIVAGILTSIAQATLARGAALGASGALMGLIGLTILLRPHAKMIIFPLPTPVPVWVGGIVFAILDLAGALTPASGIGNIAHLTGLALGLLYGWMLKQPARRPRQDLLRP